MSTKPRSVPAYRVVSDHLRQRIVGGDIAPGQALPIEADLSTHYGVHRSTLREALRQLEQDGLVQRMGKRLVVTVPQQSDLTRTAERALQLQQVTFREVWEVASTIEPLCARLAAERISEEELARLQANLAQTAELVAQGQSPVQATIQFQSLVAEAARNQALLLARAPVSLLMLAGYAAIAPRLPQSGARLLEAHQHVLESLRQRDAESAVAWTRRHLADHRRGFEVAGLDMDAPIPAPTA
jgi:GntR family transcriptional regulator, transcriptional repressor for pyruvate dehydrogenase complex